jgi:hypothetical protein
VRHTGGLCHLVSGCEQVPRDHLEERLIDRGVHNRLLESDAELVEFGERFAYRRSERWNHRSRPWRRKGWKGVRSRKVDWSGQSQACEIGSRRCSCTIT